MTTYRKGDRVKHPNMQDWGLGLVLEDSDGSRVRIFFVEAGERAISLSHVQPVIVTGPSADSLALDNLKVEGGKVGTKYKSLSASMEYFCKEFPGGFEGERFEFHERRHKRAISRIAQDRLGAKAMRDLLDVGNFREVCDRALKLTGAETNAMIFKNEKMALRDGLKSEESAKGFAESLFEVLHGDGDFDERFGSFCSRLESIGANKWTVATYFLFFMYPDRHMFVKPTITQNAADVCAFDINYKSEVNAFTYKSILQFSSYLKHAIAVLGPEDMIDVQSFMWCISPGTYGTSDL